MIIPVRCFTCGKCIAHLWDDYSAKVQEAYNKDVKPNKTNRFVHTDKLDQKLAEEKALDEVGLTRYCCRRMMLSHIDLCDKI